MSGLFFLLNIIIIILLPVVAAVVWRRHYRAAWWYFLVGVATFIAAQLLHLPLNNWLTDLGVLPAGPDSGNVLVWAVILGLTAAFSETLMRVIGFALLFRFKQAQRPEEAVMVGLGHGGIEAMGLVAVVAAAQFTALMALQGTDLAGLDLPAGQLAVLETQLALLDISPWLILAGAAERAIAMTLHVVLSVLVWLGFSRRSVWPVLGAFLYHALFDALAVYLAQQMEQVLLIEGILLLLMVPGLWFLVHMFRQRVEVDRPVVRPIADELRLFVVALRKELFQAWRTGRVIIVLAVFALFGLASPLLAFYLPQIIGGIEETAALAEIIPDPTNADALAQYIENITQFGFIIAVLLGMGSVAGEKASGTAALILSKPLPRWSFIISKFTAQALVYLLGFSVGMAGAYYYTQVLFDEGLSFLPFLAGNGLLLVWLLVFVAVTLLGSTLARSTGAGAGIALAGAIILLIAGALPVVGPFAPAGLVGWAAQLGPDVEVAANGGALAAGVVLILVLLIGSLAAFEVQEL